MTWTLADIPDLHGRRALVTGVTSGLGEVTARELARAGAEVLLAARNPARLDATLASVRAAVPDAQLVPVHLDLADLSSVRRAATEAAARGPLHILVNNAGVMATPHERTVDGFELQFATNHLGHFALTGLLWDQLAAAGGARVVAVSSNAARMARTVCLEDPRSSSRRYRKWQSYAESKLANLLFTLELDRRAAAAGAPVTAVAAHPGYAATNLVAAGMNKGRVRLDGAIALAATRLVAQSAADGSLPLLRAATQPDLAGGSYLGPGGPLEMRGPAVLVGMPGPAQDPELAARLWSLSENATAVSYP